jgi:hypothetical protein
MSYITTDIKYEIGMHSFVYGSKYIDTFMLPVAFLSRKNIERTMVIITHTQEGNMACLSCAVYWFEEKYIYSIIFYSILFLWLSRLQIKYQRISWNKGWR